MKKKTLHNFLDYTGSVKQKDNYFEFEMKNSTYIKSLNYLRAYNPTFDNLFKKVFKNEIILLNFLNDILYPNENKIKRILKLNTNFNGPYGKYSLGSINLDMLCACFFDEKTSEENNNKNDLNSIEESMDIDEDSNQKIPNEKYKLVVDIEMQRIIKESPTERFIKYMSYIDGGILNEKAIILVLLIKNSVIEKENNSAIINYSKKSLPKYKTVTEYKKNLIIEVDLNHCYNLIKNKKEIWLVDKNKTLTKNGKEWIKLLTLQIWCQQIQDEVYMLPNLEDLNFHQPQIKNALQILNIDIPLYWALIQKENEELNKSAKIIKLETQNQEKDKALQEKDKELQEKDKELQEKDKELHEKDKTILEKDNKISQLSEKVGKYKSIIEKAGLLEKVTEEDKSADDLDYYDEEDDSDDEDDENYVAEEEDEEDDDDIYI